MLEFLKAIYNKFNNSLFESRLPDIEFKTDVSRKQTAKYSGYEKIIFLGSGFISLSKEEICALILHEMIHINNQLNQIFDVNDNQYHNSHFMKEAVRVGFFVIREKYQGWSITNINQSYDISCKDYKFNQHKNTVLKTILSEINLPDNILEEHNHKMRECISSLKPSKTFFLKYECACPPPYNSIRSGRRPNGNNPPLIRCEICKSQFTCVSQLDE